MKKILLSVIVIFLFLINIDFVKADPIQDAIQDVENKFNDYKEETTKPPGPTQNYQEPSSSDKWNTSWDWLGLKITVYKKTESGYSKYSDSEKVFFNNTDSVKLANKSSVNINSKGSERLTNSKLGKISWEKRANSNYFSYLNFTSYYPNMVGFSSWKEFFNIIDEDYADLLKALDLQSEIDDTDEFILVIEPAMLTHDATSNSYYFATYWEYQDLLNQPVSEDNFRWRFRKRFDEMAKKFSINPGDIIEGGQIYNFLNTKFSKFLKQANTTGHIGVSIISLSELIPPSDPNYTTIPCTTVVHQGSCQSNTIITRPTDRDCVVNSRSNEYKSVGDCGVIYCAESKWSDINDFLLSFQPVIYSGRYVKINNVKVNISKTCYLKRTDSSASCNDWTNYITKDEPGSVELWYSEDTSEQIYIFEEDSEKSTFRVECEEKDSNGFCTKAEVKQHIEYSISKKRDFQIVLDFAPNRYISITTMAMPTFDGYNQYDSYINYDLGQPHLTTPIYFPTGTHTFTFDFSKSAMKRTTYRLEPDITIKKGNQTITLDYNTKYENDSGSHSLNLTYRCEYNVKQDPNEGCLPYECCNENKILVDCPDTCNSIMGCDEKGNPIIPKCDCPEDMCCDMDCNVFTCKDGDISPGGFPPVVYRNINLKEPFPGIDGSGRNYGANWHRSVYDERGNFIYINGVPCSAPDYYITNNRGYSDYEVYQAEPLYVINLDYNTMKAIREYNDSMSYNDFSLTCLDGEECISGFLHGDVIKSGGLIESGTCKNINHDSFYSCITRKGA